MLINTLETRSLAYRQLHGIMWTAVHDLRALSLHLLWCSFIIVTPKVIRGCQDLIGLQKDMHIYIYPYFLGYYYKKKYIWHSIMPCSTELSVWPHFRGDSILSDELILLPTGIHTISVEKVGFTNAFLQTEMHSVKHYEAPSLFKVRKKIKWDENMYFKQQ